VYTNGVRLRSLVIYGLYLHIFSDVPKTLQIGFQDSATAVMEGIIDLHHDISFFLIVILILVSVLVVSVICTEQLVCLDRLAAWRLNIAVPYNSTVVLPQKVQHNKPLEII
jgi:hypothetical protein